MSRQPDTTLHRRSTPATVFRLLAGPVIWALHFGAIYFMQSMLCAHGLATDRIAGVGAIPALIVVFTLVAEAALLIAVLPSAMVLRAGSEREPRFEAQVTVFLAILSAVAILWAGITWTIVPSCPALR